MTGRSPFRIGLGLLVFSCAVGSFPCGPSFLQAQDPGGTLDVRVVEFASDPQPANFGEPFDLRLRLRFAPGTRAVLGDTLVPTDGSSSAGPGRWTEESGPGDSLDIRASYPVLAFRSGRVELPWLPMVLQPEGGELLLPLGAVEVAPLEELAGAEGELRPRPLADVLGGNWSAWALAAVALVVVGVGFLAWVAASAWRFRRPGPGAGGPVGVASSARVRALEGLERLRARGWLEEGRMREFYTEATGVLRGYVEEVESRWPTSLTSSELIARFRDRWGDEAVEHLGPVVARAERAKFGDLHPDPDVAERDRTVIRDWIRSHPETR